MVAIGDTVVFHDPRGVAHRALVTAVHGQTTKEARDARYDEDAEKMRKDAAEQPYPCAAAGVLMSTTYWI